MLVILNNASDAPLYQQIVEQIKAKVLSGELPPGSSLPSIRQLAADLLISVITTKRAYQELEKEGYIETRTGRGTFVSNLQSQSVADLRFQEVREKLREAVALARRVGLTKCELRQLTDAVLQEEGLTDE